MARIMTSTTTTEYNGSTGQLSTSQTPVWKGETDFKTFTRNDGWWEDIKAGRSVTSPYDCRYSEVTPRYGDVGYHSVPSIGFDSWGFQNTCIIPPNLPQSSVALKQQATGEMLTHLGRKSGSLASDVQGLVVAGELGKTMKQLSHPFKSFMDLTNDYLNGGVLIRDQAFKKTAYAAAVKTAGARKLPRGFRIDGYRGKSMKAVAKAINDSYLEYTYAVQPNLHDIQAIINETTGKRMSHETTVGAYGSADKHHYDVSGNINFFGVEREWFTSYYEVCSVRSVSKILVDLSSTMDSRFGMDMPSFLPSLWELVPYSFLVDYVTNVQEILNAISYPVPRERYGFTSTRTMIFGSWGLTGVISNPDRNRYGNHYASVPPSRFKIIELNRSGTHWGVPPPFQVELPSVKQAINSASLLLARIL